MRRQPSNQLQRLYILYKNLQRNFFPTLRRKVITSESQLRIEPANTQIRHVQPRKSYASVTRTDSKQSNTKQNKQETGKNNISKLRTTYNKRYTGITKYDERIYGKNGRNSLATLVTRIT